MFKVKILINTDGDFGFTDNEFQLIPDKEQSFYFETRKDAVEALIRSFHNLRKSFHSSRNLDYIKEWIEKMDDKIELITEKFTNFTIYEELGNSEILYSLVECRKEYLMNGCTTYTEIGYLDFDSGMLPEELIDWDVIEKMPGAGHITDKDEMMKIIRKINSPLKSLHGLNEVRKEFSQPELDLSQFENFDLTQMVPKVIMDDTENGVYYYIPNDKLYHFNDGEVYEVEPIAVLRVFSNNELLNIKDKELFEVYDNDVCGEADDFSCYVWFKYV